MFVVAHNGARIWGGAEKATVMLLFGLQSRGHRVLLLCNDKIVCNQASKRGVPATNFSIGGDVAIHDAFRLATFLRELKPDAFLIGTYKKLALAALGAHIARVPRVVARIGLESDTPRSSKYRFALRHWVDGVAVNAQAMARPFVELSGFGADKITVIHNGVKAPRRQPPDRTLRESLGLSADAKVIGTVARLAKQKRIDRLIDAMIMLPSPVHCVIAGDGPRRVELERRRDELGLHNRVHFLGNREDVARILDALDLFIVPSDKEGMSNAMLEAMAFGLPVVSTRVSGAEDALSPNERGDTAGRIVDFSSRAIAEAVKEILHDGSLRSVMADTARARAAQQFSFELMLDRWEAFLQPR
jgi:glycosyltransferase involved in cell wall biosynthesis